MVEFNLLHLDADFRTTRHLNTLSSEFLKVDTGGVTEKTTAPGLVNENNVSLLLFALLSKGGQLRHVKCRSILFRSNKTAGGVCVTEQEFNLEVEDLLLLFVTDSLVVLGLLEEALSSEDEITLTDTPLLLELVEDAAFVVEDFNGTLLGDVFESDNTVGDATALDDADPSNLRGVVGVGSTTGFSVYSSDINNSQGVSGNNTTLVKSVTILLFSLSLVHE